MAEKRAAKGHSSRVGADEALTTLVSQFADPLVFLRELVQNSLDAASTQIDVDFAFDESSGLMTISVADNGEGMTEHIIDNHLLTLFSSTKESDLTKIGKFGVGFVSIFAINPHLVVLETGQAGESWRIIFHEDRRFEKLKVEHPVEGTELKLYVPADKKTFARTQERGRDTVHYWCKYAEAEILVDGIAIAEEFGIDAPLATMHHEPGTSIAYGFAPFTDPTLRAGAALASDDFAGLLSPLVGFYNRGLTLVESHCLPDERSDDLIGLSMRIKSRYLEHTLTRDNVRQDENYEKALASVRKHVGSTLGPKLREHIARWVKHYSDPTAPSPGAPPLAHALLYSRLPALSARGGHGALPVPTLEAGVIPLDDLLRAPMPAAKILSSPVSTPVTKRLHEDGIPVIRDGHGVVENLLALGHSVAPAHAYYYTATRVAGGDRDSRLLAATKGLLGKAKIKVAELVLGNVAFSQSPVHDHLYIRQHEAFALSRLHDDNEPTFFGGARDVVLSVTHPLVVQCRELAKSDCNVASLLLAQAIAVSEDTPPERLVSLAESTFDLHTEGTSS